jgi:hypothetical protein
MLELFILFNFILSKIAPLAQERGLSVTKWVLATVGVWFGVEVAVGFTCFMTLELVDKFYGLSAGIINMLYVPIYIVSVVAAALSAERVRNRLLAKPLIKTSINPSHYSKIGN